MAAEADGADGTRQVVVIVLFVLWGLRLTYNWAVGWPGMHHEDWRYVMYKDKGIMPRAAVDATVVTGFPTMQLVLGSLPLVPALVRGDNAFGVLDIVAAVVLAVALAIETIADEQLRAFVRADQPPGAILSTGLWSRIRHPNYLGELGIWLGLFLFGLAADPGWWWTGIGFVAMLSMFVFASIPMLDERSIERRPGYADHMAKVPALLPRLRS
jgi:steroid 5-alpha reductase family enzyme